MAKVKELGQRYGGGWLGERPALPGGVDALLTGDKDFLDVELRRPEIMTPAQFAAAYC